MANKLFLICATLSLCFLLINASSYRAIVEFDEDDGATNPSGPSSQQKCRKEFQQEQHLQPCQRWMLLRAGYPPKYDHEFQILLAQCCKELRQEDTVCICPTLRQAAIGADHQGEHRRHQTGKIYVTAKQLPYICNISQVGFCPFRSPYPPTY